MILVSYTALVLQLVYLGVTVLADGYIRREQKVVMGIINVLAFLLLGQNYAEYRLELVGGGAWERTLAALLGYCLRPVILALFFYLVDARGSCRVQWAMVGLNTTVHLTALFSGLCFRFDGEGAFQRGPLGYTSHVVSAILMVWLVYVTVQKYRQVRHSLLWLPISNALLVAVAALADTLLGGRTAPVSFLTIAVVCSCVFYYVWLHLQFVREHERDLMAEQRIRIMMSQIQPHFLYNTLVTIQGLCLTDPEKAFDTITTFGTYLRQNLDSLDQPKLIPFQKELEHTQVYAEIEMLRFPSIKVKYDIRDTDFDLPALTVQPLVENAIRHGVRIRETGVVRVTAYREPNYHVIEIRDNGIGFDAAKVESAGSQHIGLRNVRERIEKMCQGLCLPRRTVRPGPAPGVDGEGEPVHRDRLQRAPEAVPVHPAEIPRRTRQARPRPPVVPSVVPVLGQQRQALRRLRRQEAGPRSVGGQDGADQGRGREGRRPEECRLPGHPGQVRGGQSQAGPATGDPDPVYAGGS